MTQVGTKQAKDVWCQVKTSNNYGGIKWQTCQKCCVFCDEDNCPLRVCQNSHKDDLCCWRASPAEWMMGRLDERAQRFVYQRRRYEYELRQGVRPNDGTWEGDHLGRFKKKYPKVYQEMLAEVFGIVE